MITVSIEHGKAEGIYCQIRMPLDRFLVRILAYQRNNPNSIFLHDIQIIPEYSKATSTFATEKDAKAFEAFLDMA